MRFFIAIMETETATFIDEQDFASAGRFAQHLAEMCGELARRLTPPSRVP